MIKFVLPVSGFAIRARRRAIIPTPVPTCAAEEALRLRSKRHSRGATADIAGAATLSAKRVCGLSLLASAFEEFHY
jgi:hypothetical protein